METLSMGRQVIHIFRSILPHPCTPSLDSIKAMLITE